MDPHGLKTQIRNPQIPKPKIEIMALIDPHNLQTQTRDLSFKGPMWPKSSK